MSSEDDQISPGGSTLLLHAQEKQFEPAHGGDCIEQISAHIEQHLGPILAVPHKIVSDAIPLDVAKGIGGHHGV
ncbi:hypothetical protein FHT08_003748 [Xanthomonas campestris]|uniref:hypothetical protein n=1 Tax=Xanthomonas TaxID=338 RepID=UPI0015E2DF9A|nr:MULTISPECIES: hypothetical protein [Xanthomonas]MBB5736638.1 hypothetical protein [Xanthomonas sp. CFBP 8152]NIJ78614.1 hypothetical protein [Xanthomonas sp. CFBP 8151]